MSPVGYPRNSKSKSIRASNVSRRINNGASSTMGGGGGMDPLQSAAARRRAADDGTVTDMRTTERHVDGRLKRRDEAQHDGALDSAPRHRA
jgi:hypothetical protein